MANRKPAPRRHTVQVLMDDDTYGLLDEYAARHKWSRSQAAMLAILAFLTDGDHAPAPVAAQPVLFRAPGDSKESGEK